ncbi:docking protein 1 [Tachyglossus aculeatus]|uniref:docking protein 1 n=1 Tax=Tachyglossus aculeatus TaxID=9261 RepID=UPI0018F421F8|nr:docking protein 1 [Tachyglossus aculeatus]
MDGAALEGPLFVQSQSHRFGAKRWKKTWSVLYPPSQHGVARLEFFDGKEPSGAERLGSRRLDRKVIRLSDCVSVAPVSLDSVPRPGTAAFRLDTAQRSYLFAAECEASAAWVRTLCHIAFPKDGPIPGSADGGPGPAPALEMLENSLYCSREEASEFWVTVQRTEAAERCGLRGPYLLRAEERGLSLAEPRAQEPLFTWPYTLLRRYGRDRVMFSFEAGRRCSSGPGNFTFETKQGDRIFQAVESAIRRQRPGPGGRHSASSLEGEEPPDHPPPGGAGEPTGLYAQPLDALRALPAPPQDPLYSDPVDSRARGRAGGRRKDPRPFRGLYEHVRQQLLDTTLGGPAEPVYTEPAPPALYAEAQGPREAWRCQARPQDAGYEFPYDPATDDYAVPPFPASAPRGPKPLPAPKPRQQRRRAAGRRGSGPVRGPRGDLRGGREEPVVAAAVWGAGPARKLNFLTLRRGDPCRSLGHRRGGGGVAAGAVWGTGIPGGISGRSRVRSPSGDASPGSPAAQPGAGIAPLAPTAELVGPRDAEKDPLVNPEASKSVTPRLTNAQGHSPSFRVAPEERERAGGSGGRKKIGKPRPAIFRNPGKSRRQVGRRGPRRGKAREEESGPVAAVVGPSCRSEIARVGVGAAFGGPRAERVTAATRVWAP